VASVCSSARSCWPSSAADAVPDALIIVISGPGGAGKGTLVERLVAEDPRLWLSRSWTTRARRPGEAAEAYTFVSEDEFQELIDSDGFLEWVQFLDYRQGTPLPHPPDGTDIVLEIDVLGATEIKGRFPDAVLIFVDAPSPEEQERRLRERGDPEEKVRQRMEKATAERDLGRRMGAVTVINDDLDRAAAELHLLIAEARTGEIGDPASA
jgi:guanylate kinase